MFTRFSSNVQAIIIAFCGFAAFAISDAGVKWLTQFYPTYQLIGFYNLGILITCMIFANKLGGFKRTFKTNKLKFHIGRGITYTLLSLIIVTALSKLNLTLFYTIIFMSPFVVATMARVVFKECFTLHAGLAICVGFIGVLIVMRPGFGAFSVWMLLPLFATFFVASLSLLAKFLKQEETLLSLALYPALSNLVAVTIPAAFIHGFPGLVHLGIFLFCGAFGMIGLILTALAYQKAKANIIAPLQYTQIIWGTLFGIILFSDMPDKWTLIGAAVIVSAGLYLIHHENKT